MASIGDTTRPEYIYDQATDTWIPVGIGPHSHTPAAIGAIASSIVTTKGDIIAATGSGLVVRQGVGADGSVLVADSSQTDGLNYALGNAYAAGKNKIINGDFGVWQRGTNFTASASTSPFTADRWQTSIGTGAAATISQQAFTAGAAPVSGYESAYFLRFARTTTGSSASYLYQKIEDVRTFAGQTATVSFWAKAASTYTFATGEMYLEQGFGSGGTAGSVVTYVNGSSQTITTSWTRYTFTVSIPSVSGKTIGTGSNLALVFNFATGQGTSTFDIWGVQVEAGSVATPFQTATGTIQGELAACQRYYEQYTSPGSDVFGIGYTQNATTNRMMIPVMSKRVLPTISYTGTLQVIVSGGSSYNVTSIANINNGGTPNMINFNAVIGGGAVAGGACALYSSGATTLSFSAEL